MTNVSRTYGRRDSILFVVCVVLAFVAQFLPEHFRDPLTAALRHTVLAPLVSLQHDAEMTRQAWLTREARVTARDSVELQAMTLDALNAENDRLRKTLELGARLKWGFVPAEALQGRDIGEEYTVTLSAGSNAGVRVFSPVVAPEGLAGMVKTVDPTMSIAIVWAHPDFRVSAMAEDGSAFGIVAAHEGSDPERYLLEMRGVPVRSTLKPGTLIVSSGLGSTFPRGIPVGTVLGELKTSELWARTYLLRPAVLPHDMSTVMILLPQRTVAGVDGVWQSGRGADAAVKAIVAAGDSLERASRLARGDTAQADSTVRSFVAAPLRRDTVHRVRRDTLPHALRDASRPAAVRPDSSRAPDTTHRATTTPAVPPDSGARRSR
ncbi:MAG TPA: rod shape-determining protein MreC [Gemmatimonadaceae bacterium]|nr:rod shape-determining protein MreC [Gemmatimonadaceae bacterium]